MANDQWRTPDWLYLWLNEKYGPFDIDLAASATNTKCQFYFTYEQNALDQPWGPPYYENGFCNPPYSNLAPWLNKARRESELGFKSTWVLPAWNGEKFWGPDCFDAADELAGILGRVGFLDSEGYEIPGNRAGTMIAHYSGQPAIPGDAMLNLMPFDYVDRDSLITKYGGKDQQRKPRPRREVIYMSTD